MKKACRGIGIFVVVMAAVSYGAVARQGDLAQIAGDLTAKNSADRAEAYRMAAKNGWPVRGEGRNESYFELQKMLNGMPAYYMTFNADAAKSTNTDSTNLAIGGGAGFVLRMWDGAAPRVTHQEYIGRVTWADPNPYSIHYHPTHVAGTMIASGVQAQAKGMAYAATLRAFEWNNDLGEMTSEASAGMLLSNHSYGYTRGWVYNTSNSYWYWYGDTAISETKDYKFGFYDSESQQIDQMIVAAPNYLPVVSASNDRGEGPTSQPIKHYYYDARYGAYRFSTKTRQLDGGTTGYDCIPNGMQLSKNSLTVGAVMDVPGYTGPASVVMTTFSSWGPADDGRIKPDLVGNGYQLTSSYSTSDNSYATFNGTSMASPNVCGSLALLQDYYKDTHGGTAMWASTLKGLAIHTAREAGSNPGPDYIFGWGLLNTYAAYNVLHNDYLYDAKGYIEQLTLGQGQTIDLGYRVSSGTPELRVTISWTDPAGTPPSPSLDPRTKMLVNDLDLRALKGVDTYYPWRLDVYNPANAATKADNNVDNVEQVVVATPTPGVYTIRIMHKGTLNGGSQEVSLVVSGAEKNHVWHVYADGSGDAPTIAAAVAAAGDGDSIFAHQGTYPEAGISISKALVITGVDGAALTTVDGNGLGSGIFTFPAASKVIVIRDFTIKNGSTTILGGGIYCSNSSVTIERCVIESCYSPWYGGGIAVTSASPTIRNVMFLSNQADHDGGGLYLSASSSVVDSCMFHDNVAASSGGAIGMINSTPQFINCTVHHNSAGANGGGVYVGIGGNPALTRCVVSSATAGGGIYGETTAVGATVACCDVFGNAGGDYAGSIPDQTGINSNISTDPVFCDAGVSPPDLAISSLSPCAPALSPCAQLIGALGVGCAKGADLAIASVEFSSAQPAFGDSVRATVKIKNVGELAAISFYADYYVDVDTLPPPATTGDQRLFVGSLAAGDSIVWVTGYEKALVFKSWKSWFRVDTGNSVLETNEANNASGPYEILWTFPAQPGWPVAIGSGFHSSPAIASLDADETDLEVILGCDDGKLYALKKDGAAAAGWPVTIGDTLFSSPAVADIAGDYHKEVVIGGKDGKIYAYDYLGAKLWEYPTGNAVHRTPALVDLDRDGTCEVLCSAGGALYALDGNGSPLAGSWPYLVGTGTLTSPAVGDVDGDGALEIAAIAYGYTAPVESRVHLVKPDGTLCGGSWPVVVDTAIVADPVIGNVISPDGDLEIVAGAVNGAVYVWKSDGSVWPAIPRASGAIETSPALAQLDYDPEMEIVVSSRLYAAIPSPEHWEGLVTVIDNTGSIVGGWPKVAGAWMAAASPMPSAISIGGGTEVMTGGPAGDFYSWIPSGEPVYGFPIGIGGGSGVSAAADDIDRDGTIELVMVSGAPSGSLWCCELVGDYHASQLWWPMFRHDRARTGCYGAAVPTGVDGTASATPSATRITSIYPNPFNPSTRIAFELSARTRVEIAIYDVSGRRVAVILDREMGAGRYEVAWHGRTVSGGTAASGIYFCTFRAGNAAETRKIVLVR
jgi:hypothetical protein